MCVCVRWSSPTPQLIFPHTCNSLILFSSFYFPLLFCVILFCTLLFSSVSFCLNLRLSADRDLEHTGNSG